MYAWLDNNLLWILLKLITALVSICFIDKYSFIWSLERTFPGKALISLKLKVYFSGENYSPQHIIMIPLLSQINSQLLILLSGDACIWVYLAICANVSF